LAISGIFILPNSMLYRVPGNLPVEEEPVHGEGFSEA
jgi:hypothetical protein